jgi:hypothetical protein
VLQFIQIAVNLDFNCFVDKSNVKFLKLLKYGSKVKARPQGISVENMGDFGGYVEGGLSGF